MIELKDENSSGQGQTEEHKRLLPAPILAQYGYIYSHTTRIHYPHGGFYYRHCWKNGNHNAAVDVDKYNGFFSYGTVEFSDGGSARIHCVRFVDTEKYLKNREKRLTRKNSVV